MLPETQAVLPPISDSELTQLLAACSREEEAAQRKLYRQYYAFAISVALHYASGRAEAEEIVHDGYLKLFRALAGQPFSGNLSRYFRRILVNTGIDHYRARRRRAGIFRKILPAREGAVENEALRELGMQDVLLVLQRLSPGYRLVFNLHVVEGLSHSEIAERLGISICTSKSNLAKARLALQRIAGQYFPYDNPSPNE